ncbi:sodium/potassium/calcium exchanger 1 [Tripterygium wilfordii]|uniref:Sodium/potassium/calcium exchanger 1 n=1 Tax=Tripterygium wilfordii TaxID=458696 RepID=A0A7J7C974_TRIWF|nr:sodium/potassium/calcium exchanger 1 [Tripterygium wilfordii]
MARTSYMDLEPESSLLTAGPSAVSGAKLDGDELGGLPFDGKTTGASVGVAEFDGMLADASGAGPSAIGGAVAGTNSGALPGGATLGVSAVGGALAGVEALGVEAVGGALTGVEALGVEAVGGALAGD